MSNKLCLYERDHFIEPEMCNLWEKISISYNSCRFSVVIASVGFNNNNNNDLYSLREKCSYKAHTINDII